MAIKGSNDVFIPRNPLNIAFRPLKGVRRDLAGEAIESGEFIDIRNMGATKRGPTKRGAFEQFAGGVEVDSNATPIIDIAPVWRSDGTQFAGLLTNRYVYGVGLATLTPRYWSFATGVVKSIGGAGGLTVKFSGSPVPRFTNATYLTVGDMFVFSTGVQRSITGFPTTSSATIATSMGTYTVKAGGYSYAIRRIFHVEDRILLDNTTIDSKVVIADHKRKGMYAFNGSAVSNYSPTMASQGFAPGCVVYFKDRLWVGNLREGVAGADHKRQRIRWSGVAGDPRTWRSIDYLDLPYQPGFLRRLLPLGNLLVAYFEDAIWYGVPTNLVDLPYKFDKVETGGIGLAGPRALTSFLGGHFYVGQDNIYMLPSDPRGGPIPIGDPIAMDTILACEYPENIYAVVDPKNQRVLFGFPKTSPTIQEIWAYDYVAKAWSHLDYDVTMLANPLIDLTLTWSDLSSFTWTTLGVTYPSWTAMGQGTTYTKDVYVGYGGELQRLGTGDQDANGGAIPTRLETPDHDMGDPGVDKTFTRLSVKLRERPSNALTILTSGSDDGGNTWTRLGTLAIPATQREGAVDFAITGSAVRFRLSCATVCNPYTVSEYEVRVRPRGREMHLD